MTVFCLFAYRKTQTAPSILRHGPERVMTVGLIKIQKLNNFLSQLNWDLVPNSTDKHLVSAKQISARTPLPPPRLAPFIHSRGLQSCRQLGVKNVSCVRQDPPPPPPHSPNPPTPPTPVFFESWSYSVKLVLSLLLLKQIMFTVGVHQHAFLLENLWQSCTTDKFRVIQ